MEDYEMAEKAPIGLGSFSKVYKAKSRISGKFVALKVARIESNSENDSRIVYDLTRIEREASIWKELNHECLCGLIDYFFIESSVVVFVMEYAEEGDLLSIIDEGLKVLSLETIVKYFKQLCEAVVYLHSSRQIVHGDIKLENILINGEENVKLTDFGLSRHASTALNHYCGSVEYSAPEVLTGKVIDPFKTDIWSMGVVLYSLLFGKFPFDSVSEKALKSRILIHDPSYSSENDYPDALIVILKRLLNKNPERRPDVKELLEQLNQL